MLCLRYVCNLKVKQVYILWWDLHTKTGIPYTSNIMNQHCRSNTVFIKIYWALRGTLVIIFNVCQAAMDTAVYCHNNLTITNPNIFYKMLKSLLLDYDCNPMLVGLS